MKYRNIYMIGIGGIGMSAIARYFHAKGHEVSGYDRTPSEITASLEAEGIAVHFDERPELIPGDPSDTLVIYTPAIPAENRELVFVREKGYRLLKRSRVLGEIAEGKKTMPEVVKRLLETSKPRITITGNYSVSQPMRNSMVRLPTNGRGHPTLRKVAFLPRSRSRSLNNGNLRYM